MTVALKLRLEIKKIVHHLPPQGLNQILKVIDVTVPNLKSFCALLDHERYNFYEVFIEHLVEPSRYLEWLAVASDMPSLHQCLFPAIAILTNPPIAAHFFGSSDSPRYGGNLLASHPVSYSLVRLLANHRQHYLLHLAVMKRAVTVDFNRMQSMGLIRAFIKIYPGDMGLFECLRSRGRLTATILSHYLKYHANVEQVVRALFSDLGEDNDRIRLASYTLMIAVRIVRFASPERGQLLTYSLETALLALKGAEGVEDMVAVIEDVIEHDHLPPLEELVRFAQSIPADGIVGSMAWLVVADRIIAFNSELQPPRDLIVATIPALLQEFHSRIPSVYVEALAVVYFLFRPRDGERLAFLDNKLLPPAWQPLAVRLNRWFKNGPITMDPYTAGECNVQDEMLKGRYLISVISERSARETLRQTEALMAERHRAFALGDGSTTVLSLLACKRVVLDLVACWIFLMERGERVQGMLVPIFPGATEDTWEEVCRNFLILLNASKIQPQRIFEFFINHLINMDFHAYFTPSEVASLIHAQSE